MKKNYKDIFTKDFLEEEYINKRKSMSLIAKENSVSQACIYTYIKNLNIKIQGRTYSGISMENRKFGSLTVIKKDGRQDSGGCFYYLCKCKCGNIVTRGGTNLRKNIKDGCEKCRIKNNNAKYKGYKEISGSVWGKIKLNAKFSNRKFNINIKYIWKLFLKQNRKCSLSGIDLNFGLRHNDLNKNASLDRIDSNKGYIKGNVQWIHKDINFLKQDFTEEYLIQMCRKIVENHDNKFR